MIGHAIYIALEVLVALACCLGNTLVVCAVWMNRSLRQPTFLFVVSLAVADFLVGAVAIPLAIVLEQGVVLPVCGCLFICCILLVLTQSSVLSLLAIAVDRYLRVRLPHRYKRIATQRHSWLAVALCWFIACILGFTPLFGWHKDVPNNKTMECKFTDVMDMSYMVYFNFFGCILPPLLAMMILYVQVFRTIRKHLRENMAGSQESFYLKEANLAQSLALVLVLFAICWLPLHLMNCAFHFDSKAPKFVFYIGILLSHVNSAVNPVVYAFKIRKFQSAYLAIWRRYVLCQSEEVSQGEQSADILASSAPNR
ncbi:adenosine receptor A3-like [Megalops cyprinoides]|uniref:adenosine receptor A3-like n=1 Tax=Megalops cyprinoides TaxID=118141 RepID=UPI001864074F|nr:adenosine receptor A3-like [Megalops cyprinoides]